MSIIVQRREFTEPLNSEIQELLDAISDFEFTLSNGLVFKISDINQNVPVYMDKSEAREEKCKITWGKLQERIDQLKREQQYLQHKEDKTSEEKDRFEYLFGLIKQLNETADRYKNDHPDPNLGDIVTFSQKTALNGYYTRKGKSHHPEIVLLMETLGNDRWNAEDVAITLVHEMFHAFYDCDLSQTAKYLPYVEEPLTEYAMLKYMEALSDSDNNYSGLFEDAKSKVKRKQYSLGIAHYGFGYYLWKYANKSGQTLDNIQWIEVFREAKYKIWHKSPEYIEYAKPFKQGVYPFDKEEFDKEEYQMELLRVILCNAKVCLSLPQKRYAFVDLGLPSGTLWATCNVGANSPEEYGDYFAWGETQPKEIYWEDTYKYGMDFFSSKTLTKYCITDKLTTLLPEDDAATANWGNEWRMPTKEEWQELKEKTTCIWTTQNGMKGRLFTASNGHSLFLPAAGERLYSHCLRDFWSDGYWSSSLCSDDPRIAWFFYFDSLCYQMMDHYRHVGRSVRAVRSARQK